MNRNNRMIKTTLIYFIGNFGSKLLSFLLLPLYTYWLSPKQFGEIDLLLNIIPLIGPIFTLQTTETIFRFLFECKSDEEKRLNITNAFVIYICGMICFFVIYIPYCIISDFKYSFLFGVYFVILYFSIFVQQVMRGFQKNILYSLSGILSTLVYGVTNVFLIKIISEKSLLIAPTLGAISIIIFGFFKIKLFSFLDYKLINGNIIKKQLNYSLPLVPNQISWWVNGVIGKYIINFFIGTSANGILAVATKFPNLLSTITQIYFLAWVENSIYEYKSKDRDEYFSNNLNGLIEFLLFSMSGILIVVKVYFLYAIDEKYTQALNLIPILFLAMLFNSISTFLGSVYTASQKTKDAFFTTIYAGISNIILSFIMIPKLGLYGYAFANLFSYIVFSIVRMKSVKKICDIKIKLTSSLSIVSFIVAYISYLNFDILKNIVVLFIIGILFLYNYKEIIKKVLLKNK